LKPGFLPAPGAVTKIARAVYAPLLLAQASYQKPLGATSPKYFEFLELNAHIIYPLLAVLVLALLIAGILQAWRSQDLDGLAKAELKREVILELRRVMGGSTVETLSKAVGLEPFKLVKLLEEMQKDGIVGSHTTSQRLTVWQLVGVGPVREEKAR
jgi:hypothetical protein